MALKLFDLGSNAYNGQLPRNLQGEPLNFGRDFCKIRADYYNYENNISELRTVKMCKNDFVKLCFSTFRDEFSYCDRMRLLSSLLFSGWFTTEEVIGVVFTIEMPLLTYRDYKKFGSRLAAGFILQKSLLREDKSVQNFDTFIVLDWRERRTALFARLDMSRLTTELCRRNSIGYVVPKDSKDIVIPNRTVNIDNDFYKSYHRQWLDKVDKICRKYNIVIDEVEPVFAEALMPNKFQKCSIFLDKSIFTKEKVVNIFFELNIVSLEDLGNKYKITLQMPSADFRIYER